MHFKTVAAWGGVALALAVAGPAAAETNVTLTIANQMSGNVFFISQDQGSSCLSSVVPGTSALPGKAATVSFRTQDLIKCPGYAASAGFYFQSGYGATPFYGSFVVTVKSLVPDGALRKLVSVKANFPTGVTIGDGEDQTTMGMTVGLEDDVNLTVPIRCDQQACPHVATRVTLWNTTPAPVDIAVSGTCVQSPPQTYSVAADANVTAVIAKADGSECLPVKPTFTAQAAGASTQVQFGETTADGKVLGAQPSPTGLHFETRPGPFDAGVTPVELFLRQQPPPT